MHKVYFADGSKKEISEQEMLNLVKRLTYMGLKVFRTRYCDPEELWVLTPSNISRVVIGDEDGEDTERETVETVSVQEVPAEREEGTGDPEDTREDEPAPKTQQQINDEYMAEIKAKSDCAGNGHEGQEQVIHYQDVMIKRKGAKKSLPSRRYFPVCSFCGLRQKYVKADSLTDEQKENAKLYEV
jgi:hypothetical protein